MYAMLNHLGLLIFLLTVGKNMYKINRFKLHYLCSGSFYVVMNTVLLNRDQKFINPIKNFADLINTISGQNLIELNLILTTSGAAENDLLIV